jgi:hypothetical protein
MSEEVTITAARWTALRRHFGRAFAAGYHFSIASVDRQGAPYVTPIGSVLLGELGHAYYFELFAAGLAERLRGDPRVSILAVDSGRTLWRMALVRARFPRPPAVRLSGHASHESRVPTPDEIARWRHKVRGSCWLPGHQLLWGRLDRVRDLHIERLSVMQLGSMTRGLDVR